MKCRFDSRPRHAATLVLLVLTISSAAWAAQETRIHEFNEGVDPVGLVADSAGNLYGTTGSDGFYRHGTVFQVRPSLGGIWTESTIYSFSAASDGGNPEAVLTLDAKGNLYGTTQYGGDPTCACGTVFELSPAAGGLWQETTLYAFVGGSDGSNPRYTNLVFDKSGNLYGVTEFGGSFHAGTVFELSPQAGGGWSESVLYDFAGGTSDGANPLGGVVFDKAGNLYGSLNAGGSSTCGSGCGAVFELSPKSGGGWQEQILYFFKNNGSSDGLEPDSLLIIDPAGNLYGTTLVGGSSNCGIVYELSPGTGGSWSKRTLHQFLGYPDDGCEPFLNLVRDSTGNLYGIAEAGGLNGSGTVFELNSSGTEVGFFDFSGGDNGADPRSLILNVKRRALFGVTFGLGSNQSGLIFEITN